MDKGKLTVLFIRDDSTVRRFRVRPFWVKFAIYVFVAALLISAASSYGVYNLWLKYTRLRAVHNELELANHEMQVSLERLENLEKLRNAGVQEVGGNETGEPAAKEQAHPAPAEPREMPEATAVAEEPRRLDENQIANLYPPLDKDIIEVNNLMVKTDSGDAIGVTFDIKNVDEADRPISGRVNLSLITWEGDKLPLEVNRSNLSFRIQWFKSMKTTFPLPQGEKLSNVYALRLTVISSDGETILQETHPLKPLLSRPGA